MPTVVKNQLYRIAIITIVLCVLVTSTALGTEASVNNVSVNAAPLNIASSAVNGMVRVFLSSLGNPSNLTLTVAGNYSLSTGQSLSSGEVLTVGFSSSTGAITLTRNGIKTNMGTYFSLRRHTATGTNGVKISQARQPSNPYPGDISFRAVKQSSGSYKLYTVAHVYIENYLYGVLPYEMGSSAPAEALKSQAVAARTYTVRMMNSRSSGYYDVVDTTNDQVYNGTPTGYAACVAAVDATKGVVLKNGSAYTATYYSASNGGQTESIYNIWGSSGYNYLNVRDDPFDYANPDSVVKKTTVYTNAANSANNASLMSLLKSKAVSSLSSGGYRATSANTSITSIDSIVAHTPMYPSPSKLYTMLDFSLTAATVTSSGSSVSASVTVTCNIFSELESMLGMSIQSSKNELWSITKNSSSFTIAARRFGHGLGLSQRGAMYMGKLGYTYDQILGFYYPDSTRIGTTFTNTILSASGELVTTEEQAADVNGGTGSGANNGVVKLSSNAGVLAIRNDKSNAGAILGVAANSSPVSVLSNDGTWSLIKYGALVGYVPSNSLTISGTVPDTSSETVSTIAGFATVKANGYLNLRSSGSYSGGVVGTAPTGGILTVFDRGTSWAYIQYGAVVAYASTDFLTFSSSYPGNVDNSGGSSTAVIAVSNADRTYMRSSASTSGNVVLELLNGTTVNVTMDDGSWAIVEYNGVSGYVLSEHLNYGGDTTPGGNEPTPTPPPTSTDVTVKANPGYMMMDADEASAMIMDITMGQSVVVLSQNGNWSAIRYNGVDGYILTSSLQFSQSGGDTGATTATVVTESGSLNMRSAASAGSSVLTTIPRGATVTVVSKGTQWSYVSYSGYTGYSMNAFLAFSDDSSGGIPDGGGTATTATVTTVSGTLNLRQSAKAGSTILRTIPRLATVDVISKGAEWSNVVYGGTNGYVMSVFLTFAADLDNGAVIPPEEEDNDPDDGSGNTGDGDDTATGQLTAIVSTASGSLNLRADMLPGSRILTRIPKGATITVQQKLSAWSQTSYNGYSGYVMNAYLTFPADSTTTSPDAATTATVMTASGSLNLRAAPYGSVLTTIPQFATVQVQQRGGTWCYVLYGNVYGYAMTAYLSFPQQLNESAATESTLIPTETPSSSDSSSGVSVTAVVYTPSGSLNLRMDANAAADIYTTIPRLTTITVLERGDSWSKVVYGNYTGYVQSSFLQFGNSNATLQPTATPAPIATNTATAAWVYTASGSLNLRESASSSAGVITAIPRLAEISLLMYDSTWSQVQYNGNTGYVMTTFIATTKPSELGGNAAPTQSAQSATPTPAPTQPMATEDPTLTAPQQPLYATITPKDFASTLTLWEKCTETEGRLLDMIRDAQVEVVRRGDTWCEVLYYNQKGFCLTEGLTLLAQ